MLPNSFQNPTHVCTKSAYESLWYSHGEEYSRASFQMFAKPLFANTRPLVNTANFWSGRLLSVLKNHIERWIPMWCVVSYPLAVDRLINHAAVKRNCTIMHILQEYFTFVCCAGQKAIILPLFIRGFKPFRNFV